MRPLRPLRTLAALSAVALVGACGSAASGPGSSSSTSTSEPSSPTSSTSSSPSASTEPQDPTLPPTSGTGKVRMITVTGSLSDGVEAGCLLLTPSPTDTNGPWMLMGKVAGLKAGQQVTVRGYRVENVASTCQQGRPLQVEDVVTS